MNDNFLCYFCGENASIETVRGEGGQRFDVSCEGECPRYEISRLAIAYLKKHPAHLKGAVATIKGISAAGKSPVVRTVGVPKQLLCTSREDDRNN